LADFPKFTAKSGVTTNCKKLDGKLQSVIAALSVWVQTAVQFVTVYVRY